MFDTDETINKILGSKNKAQMKDVDFTCPVRLGINQGSSRMNAGFGFGQRMNTDISNSNVNLVEKLNKLLDNLPEVKKAEGELKIQLKNGNVVKLQLHYNEESRVTGFNFGGI